MNDINRYKLKRTISGALGDIEEMKQQLAFIREQCRELELAMRAIRVNSKRSLIHKVPRGNTEASNNDVKKANNG